MTGCDFPDENHHQQETSPNTVKTEIKYDNQVYSACVKNSHELGKSIIACDGLAERCVSFGTCQVIYNGFKCNHETIVMNGINTVKCNLMLEAAAEAIDQINEQEQQELHNSYNIGNYNENRK